MAFGPDDIAGEMGVRVYGADFVKKSLAPVPSSGGWYPLIHEPYSGAWQQNQEIGYSTQLAFYAVYACITRIANDMGKLRARLVERDENGIWAEADSPAYAPVLRKPNRYQNHIQFKEWWTLSKLTRGNTYALKQRDNRGVVTALFLLDPNRVEPLVAPDGAIYYRLRADELNGQPASEYIAPASEIIHDRMNCLFHPLVGISPLYACGIAAGQGLAIQKQSSTFFGNGARPSGVLTAPGAISQEAANRVQEAWATKFTGANAGRVAVLGDGLKYEPMVMTATDAQLVEQLKMTADVVCSVFHVPLAKIGLGPDASASNADTRNQNYFDDCLGYHVEQWELCMDEGLGIGYGVKIEGRVLGVDLDVEEGRWRMNSPARISSLVESIGGGLHATNEARREVNLPPVGGGETIFRQQQDFPISLLAGRELDPKPVAAEPAEPAVADPEPSEDDAIRALAASFAKSLEAA